MSSVIYGLKPTMSVVAQKYMSVSSMASRGAKRSDSKLVEETFRQYRKGVSLLHM